MITAPHPLVAELIGNKAANTAEAYLHDLNGWKRFLGANDIGTAVEHLLSQDYGRANALVRGYRDHLLTRQGLAPATTNRRLAVLSSLVNIARKRGLVPWTIDIASLPPGSTSDRPVSASQVRDILAPLGEAPADLRDGAMLRLIHELGLRTTDIVQLDASALNDAELSPATRRALEAWLDLRGSADGPLFPSLSPANPGGCLTSRGVLAIVKRRARAVGLDITARALARPSEE